MINRFRRAGGVVRFVSLIPSAQGWLFDIDSPIEIEQMPIMVKLLSPAVPKGAVINNEEWQALIVFCQWADCWLINDSAISKQIVH